MSDGGTTWCGACVRGEDGRREDVRREDGRRESGIPFWSRSAFLNWLSALTFVVLLAAQIWWWHDHGRPLTWVLLVATPLLAFLPAGVILKVMRRRWTRAWATANDFTYRRDPQWPEPQWEVPPFSVRRARRKRIRDGVTGWRGAYPARYFHYTWWNNNRVQVSSHYRNVFALRLPAALPRLTLGINIDTSSGDRVLFESSDFNDRFMVYCPDAAFAHAVFTPQTIDALLTLSRRDATLALTKFEILGDEFIAITTRGNRPVEISQVFDALVTIADGIPRFVWRDRGVSRAGKEF